MNNIDPNLWGESGWTFLHYITFAYPDLPSEKDKISAMAFFSQLPYILPCQVCRINLKDHLQKYPLNKITVQSRFNLIMWLLNIHNEVNIQRKKPIFTYDDAIKKYLYSETQTNYSSLKYYLLNSLLILILIILCIFMIKSNKFNLAH
jgi:hypothetical protein